jgi:hypothetical protein
MLASRGQVLSSRGNGVVSPLGGSGFDPFASLPTRTPADVYGLGPMQQAQPDSLSTGLGDGVPLKTYSDRARANPSNGAATSVPWGFDTDASAPSPPKQSLIGGGVAQSRDSAADSDPFAALLN